MVQWLSARQAGVNAGRAAWCYSRRSSGERQSVTREAINCEDAAAIHAAAGVEVRYRKGVRCPAVIMALEAAVLIDSTIVQVLHGSEVNLVLTSMQNGFPNNILK